MASVLLVDDEPNIRRMVGALLASEGYEVRDAPDGTSALAQAAAGEPDVVVLVMMSGRAGLADAVRATKLGAFTFLEKPLTPEGVLLALASALELRQARRAARALREDLGLGGTMVGDSAPIRAVRDLLARVAPTDTRVLITGESGTGKELA